MFGGFNFDKNMHSLTKLSSNHNPVTLKLRIRLPPEPLKIASRINWTQFHQLTNNLPPSPPDINSTNDIDLLVETITSEIKSAIDCTTTKTYC